MGMPEWTAEANRLLDLMAEARLARKAASDEAHEFGKKVAAADEVYQAAAHEFDTFIRGCVQLRFEAAGGES